MRVYRLAAKGRIGKGHAVGRDKLVADEQPRTRFRRGVPSPPFLIRKRKV